MLLKRTEHTPPTSTQCQKVPRESQIVQQQSHNSQMLENFLWLVKEWQISVLPMNCSDQLGKDTAKRWLANSPVPI